MSFTIKLAGTPYEFQAEASETILQAGDKAGFLLPSACRSGACGACKAQVLSGTVALGPHEPFALTEADHGVIALLIAGEFYGIGLAGLEFKEGAVSTLQN